MEQRQIDYDTLYGLYIVQGLKIKQICKILNAGGHTVGRELKRHKLTKSSSDYNTKHGMSDTRQYKIWQQLKVRCDNPKSIHYSNYGGKAINYDNKWHTFEGFWEDMKEGYSDDLTIDRIESDKNYCKANCRWTTYKVQNNNKSDNIITPKSIQELSEITRLSQSAIYARIRKGWSVDRIISTPKLSNNGKEEIKIESIKRKNI